MRLLELRRSDGVQDPVDEHPQQPDDQVSAEDGESILGRVAERVGALQAIAEEWVVSTVATAAIAALIRLCTKQPSRCALHHVGATRTRRLRDDVPLSNALRRGISQAAHTVEMRRSHFRPTSLPSRFCRAWRFETVQNAMATSLTRRTAGRTCRRNQPRWGSAHTDHPAEPHSSGHPLLAARSKRSCQPYQRLPFRQVVAMFAPAHARKSTQPVPNKSACDPSRRQLLRRLLLRQDAGEGNGAGRLHALASILSGGGRRRFAVAAPWRRRPAKHRILVAPTAILVRHRVVSAKHACGRAGYVGVAAVELRCWETRALLRFVLEISCRRQTSSGTSLGNEACCGSAGVLCDRGSIPHYACSPV